MSESSGSSRPCEETAGFLFSHPCPRPATKQCVQCQKWVCDRHAVRLGESPDALCTSCGRKEHRRALRRRDHDEYEHDDWYRHDPYFYAVMYYTDYGYYGHGSWGYHHLSSADPDDFSEADGASLHEDEHDFEHDMGAS